MDKTQHQAYETTDYGPVAQLGEHPPVEREAAGSKPVRSAVTPKSVGRRYTGCVNLKQPGVYALKSPVNGKVLYVGSTQNMHRRRLRHLNLLSRGAHLHGLQEWFGASGVAPDFVVVEACSVDQLDPREMHWFGVLKPSYFGKYPANGAWKITESTRKRISKSVRAYSDARGDYVRDSDGNAVREHMCSLCHKPFLSRKRSQYTCSVSCRTELTKKLIDLSEAQTLYNAGWSYRDLAVKYGVSRSVIQRRFKEEGVPVRSNTVQPKRNNKICDTNCII